MPQTRRGGYYPPACQMKFYVHTHMFWYNINCVFNFARIACNRVQCTRTGEHGSPLQTIHGFHYIKKFLLNIIFYQGGRIISAPTNKQQLSYKQKTVGKQCFAFCKLSSRPKFSIFHFQLSILKKSQMQNQLCNAEIDKQ